MIRKFFDYFTKFEKWLWLLSTLAVVLSYVLFDRTNWLAFVASLIGVDFLILNAKGNPFGQLLTIVFSVFYGYISYTYSYYGEMLTYLFMTAPMAFIALIAWIRHPYDGKKSEVEVGRLSRIEVVIMFVIATIVTAISYFLLRYFGTQNLVVSTFSVATSFVAVYLTFRRSPYFAIAYASNDVVLIILWGLASLKDKSYISVFVCFVVFLVNDIYGFVSWLKMKKKQSKPVEIL